MSGSVVFPKLHNAMWPGLVGKGGETEPAIGLDRMLDMTVAASFDGVKFDGVDLFATAPHTDIDASDDELKALADNLGRRGLVAGSIVAPVWPPVGGGSAMGSADERRRFLDQLAKACGIGARLRALGVRPYGVIRIDSATGVEAWAGDPEAGTAQIARTFMEACDIAADHGEVLSAEGEICWGGMQSWRTMLDLLERVGRPERLGFQADMAHTLLYTLGHNAPDDRILPSGYDWRDPATLDEALRVMTDALRPWTNDFHVAQNDATVKGMGSHDKTGRHCLPNDPGGKLDIVRASRFWLRDDNGKLTRRMRHICWDGCMFANDVMQLQATWNEILAAMVSVQRAHGWSEPASSQAAA